MSWLRNVGKWSSQIKTPIFWACTYVMEWKACMDELIFQRIDVSARSALSAELVPGRRKGIYFYVFDDGIAYVGKSVDMVGRYAQHMPEYRHRGDFDGAEIEKAYFASVDDGTDAVVLDDLETDTICRADPLAIGRLGSVASPPPTCDPYPQRTFRRWRVVRVARVFRN